MPDPAAQIRMADDGGNDRGLLLAPDGSRRVFNENAEPCCGGECATCPGEQMPSAFTLTFSGASICCYRTNEYGGHSRRITRDLNGIYHVYQQPSLPCIYWSTPEPVEVQVFSDLACSVPLQRVNVDLQWVLEFSNFGSTRLLLLYTRQVLAFRWNTSIGAEQCLRVRTWQNQYRCADGNSDMGGGTLLIEPGEGIAGPNRSPATDCTLADSRTLICKGCDEYNGALCQKQFPQGKCYTGCLEWINNPQSRCPLWKWLPKEFTNA